MDKPSAQGMEAFKVGMRAGSTAMVRVNLWMHLKALSI
jgi:hypothetical protein